MGWLDIAFDAAMLSTQISQRTKLQQLQQQHAEAAVIQAVVLALRQEIFKFKQTGEEIVAVSEKFPKQAAGALEILYQRFQQAGLTPDLFPELGDKEYVAATARYLREQRESLFTQLTPTEQLEVKSVASAAMILPRYNDYLSNCEQVMNYRAALPLYQTLKSRKDMFFGISAMMALAVLGLSMTFVIAKFVDNNTTANLSCWGAMLMMVGAVLLQQRWTRPADFKRMRSIVETTKAKVDLERFAALEKELGADYAIVKGQQQTAQNLISEFFAVGNFSALLKG